MKNESPIPGWREPGSRMQASITRRQVVIAAVIVIVNLVLFASSGRIFIPVGR